MTYVLWKEFMTVDPKAPKWNNRDRFVLSAGHGSMLNYSLLHLMGYNLQVRRAAALRVQGLQRGGVLCRLLWVRARGAAGRARPGCSAACLPWMQPERAAT